MPKPRRWFKVPMTIYAQAIDERNARGMCGFVTKDSAGGRLRFKFGEVDARLNELRWRLDQIQSFLGPAFELWKKQGGR